MPEYFGLIGTLESMGCFWPIAACQSPERVCRSNGSFGRKLPSRQLTTISLFRVLRAEVEGVFF